jgi:AraC-like DNA-binding protein
VNTWSLVDTINTISIFIFCIFSLFLFTQKRGKPSSNRTMGLFLLAWSLALLNSLLSRHVRLVSSSLIGLLFTNAVGFLWGPLLYFYVRSVAYRDFIWRRSRLIHALPMIFYLMSLAAFAILDPGSFGSLDDLKNSFFGRVGISLFSFFLACQLLTYLGASLLVLRSYRNRIKNTYSFLEKLNLNWLYLIIGGFGLIWLIGLINELTMVVIAHRTLSIALSIITFLISFSLANVIIFRGLKQPEIFSGIDEKPKYEKSPLTDGEADQLLMSLKNHMAARKPHLVPGLSISGLAKDLTVPSRHLSQVINSRLGKNFIDFVNSYRIEEAKRLLSESGANGKTILEIAYEAGFNSKSVFNKAFKKHAGMAPQEFRRKAGPGEKTTTSSQK